MPGYKVFLQDDGDIREGLTCSYCKLVLKDPVQTSESGQRLCRECFDKATKRRLTFDLHCSLNCNTLLVCDCHFSHFTWLEIKDPSFADELDPYDEVWPDSAVKREIANLEVKCENYMVGCDWKGLFKQLMQHSQECQYVTVECRNHGCGQKVPLTKMDEHLKECPQQRVNCKDCGKETYFIEVQEHGAECPNAPKACKNCTKKIPASKLADHMIHECKHIRCVCKEESNIYEAGSTKFYDHLQDVTKLADHLGPMICEFTKISEAFKEITVAYQRTTKRIEMLEKDHQQDAQRIEMLEKRNNDLSNEVDKLKQQHLMSPPPQMLPTNDDEPSEKFLLDSTRLTKLEGELEDFKELYKDHDHGKLQLEQENSQRIGYLEDEIDNLKRHYPLPVPSSQMSVSGNEIVPYTKPSGEVKQLEEKVLKIERILNIISVHHSFGNEMVPYKEPSGEVKQLEEKVLEIERTLNVISVHHSELELQLQASLASTHNGAFLWRIPEVRRRIRDAKIGRITSIYSPPFYTGRNGYKMCIRAYLNGDGTGEGTHLSIFFVLMRGEYDPLLQWPFESEVSLILVDQDHKKHLVQTFKPNPQSSSFQKPKTDMNVASGCPEFADLSILDNTSYVKDDVMYIKAIVDTSKIFHP